MTLQKPTSPKIENIFLLVFLPFAGGYFLSYLVRNIPTVIAPNMREALGLSNTDLGLIFSAYFLSFAAVQIPLGMALDRFGPRKVQTLLMFIAALGCLVFAASSTPLGLTVGRLLVGLGVSGGLMASLKALAMWYPKDRLPTMNGFFFAFGGLGAIFASKPAQLALEFITWRGIFVGLALFCVLVALAIFFAVPEKPKAETGSAEKGVIKRILSDYRFWCIVPPCLLCNGAGMALLSLWSGTYFRDVVQADENTRAFALLMISIVMAIGFAGSGVAFSWAHKRGLSWGQWFVYGSLANAICLLAIGCSDGAWSYWPWLALAVTSNIVTVSFAYLTGVYGVGWAARANTLLNLSLFVTAFGSQFLFGGILDQGQAMGFSLNQAYALGFYILAVLQLILVPLTIYLFYKAKTDVS